MALTLENAWWNEGGLWEDNDLKRVETSPLHYRPEVFLVSELKPGTIFTLRGPRRVGKTVSLKLLIVELIQKKHVNPKTILWMTLDTIRTMSQMETYLTHWIEKMKPRYLFVDEVTSVIGWQRVIKKLADIGLLANLSVVLTGSSAHDLKRGSERMAGRKGGSINADRVLLPMSYDDFIKQVPFAGGKNLKSYLEMGGFPFRVADFIDSKGKLAPHENLSVFDDVFFYEINRRKLDRNIAIEILSRLSEIKNHAISYESFVKPLSIAKDTLRKYLNAFGDAFLLATIYSFDTGRNHISIKKDKKFVWMDPALSYLAKATHQGEESDEAARAEWALGVMLLRQYEVRIWEGLSAPRNVFTWKSSSGNEVDFLVVDKSKKLLIPYEMKYQSSISDWDFQVIERAFHKGFLITRDFAKNRKESKAIAMETFLLNKS